jgi:DNA polymerase III, gamma/tau subunits
MKLEKYFDEVIKNNTVDGTWLFLGIDLEKSFNFAFQLAQKLTSFEYIYIMADSDVLAEQIKEKFQVFDLSIKQVQEIQKTLYLSSESKKVLIIKEIEKMSLEAQNALLKITEEPPKNTVFFFVSNDENKILPTILSRVRVIKIPIFPQDNFYRERIDKKMEQLLSSNNPLKIYNEEFAEMDPVEFLENLVVLLRDQVFDKFGIKDYKFTNTTTHSNYEILEKAIKALEGVKYANLNPRLQIENILFNLPRK